MAEIPNEPKGVREKLSFLEFESGCAFTRHEHGLLLTCIQPRSNVNLVFSSIILTEKETKSWKVNPPIDKKENIAVDPVVAYHEIWGSWSFMLETFTYRESNVTTKMQSCCWECISDWVSQLSESGWGSSYFLCFFVCFFMNENRNVRPTPLHESINVLLNNSLTGSIIYLLFWPLHKKTSQTSSTFSFKSSFFQMTTFASSLSPYKHIPASCAASQHMDFWVCAGCGKSDCWWQWQRTRAGNHWAPKKSKLFVSPDRKCLQQLFHLWYFFYIIDFIFAVFLLQYILTQTQFSQLSISVSLQHPSILMWICLEKRKQRSSFVLI